MAEQAAVDNDDGAVVIVVVTRALGPCFDVKSGVLVEK